MSWAWDSQNACFVSPRQDAFTGLHVHYLTEIPPHSELYIELIPKDPQANMSLYAYSGGDYQMVPDLQRCVSCEASFRPSIGSESNNHRKVSLRAVNNPYKVVIGVAGAQKLSEGAYILTTYLK